jgi:hypothetical protein
MNSMMTRKIAALIASDRTLRKRCTVKNLIVTILGITTIVAAKAVIAQAGDHGPKLIHTESVGQETNGVGSFGPVGPNCDPSTGNLTGCSYATNTFKGSGDGTSGPFTLRGSFILQFGRNGAFITPSGQVDDAGNPVGYCAPVFSTSTATFRDGTLTSNGQGVACCASTHPSRDCPITDPFGPPNVGRSAFVITGGTGKYAGATGGSSGSSSQTTDSEPIFFHSEGVIQLPGDSE